MSARSYDALLFVSFGGPEAPDEVVPFLQRVTAGRNIPAERLEVVGAHYFARGGISPLNQLNREMIAALRAELANRNHDLAIYWGNRNSAPFLDDVVQQMADDGVSRALAFVTSAYSSYSGCRQYRENLAQARSAVGDDAPEIDKLRVFFNHPGFIDPLADGLRSKLDGVDLAAAKVFFTAHSIPVSMADSSMYVEQLESACELVAQALGDAMPDWELVWQSRSGPPSMPWLEPDIVDAVNAVGDNTDTVIVVPIGFISDHMEVIQDLDTDAAEAAALRGLDFRRVATSGTDPRFIAMIADLVAERTAGETPVSLGPLQLVPTQCSENCCPAPRRPTPGQTKPAAPGGVLPPRR